VSTALFSATSKSSTRKNKRRAVARRSLLRTRQGGMLVRAPLVEAEQDRSIRIQDLTKVVMVQRCLGLAEERLVPFRTTGNVSDADDRPRAFHRSSSVGLAVAFHRCHLPDERHEPVPDPPAVI